MSTDQAIARLLALGGELVPPTPGTPRRKFDLAHMRTLLHALAVRGVEPQLRFPSVLIAGTNGKGSTAATLASILQAAGHRTGLYTSPHLEQPNERIRIDGLPISDRDLAGHFMQVEAVAGRLIADGQLPHMPSFFETITAVAFLHFAGFRPHAGALESPGTQPARADAITEADSEKKNDVALAFGAPVDIAVLEVGLGGRLDATNVVEPLVSVLTDISLDHTEWLGSTLAEITREKAGILRPGGTLITLPQHPEANQTIGEIAMPLGVHAINAGDYLPPRLSSSAASSRELDDAAGTSGSNSRVREAAIRSMFRNRYTLSLPADTFLKTNNDTQNSIENGTGGVATLQVDSPLSGSHQQRNIALAIATALALHRQHGFSLTPAEIEQGIRDTAWPARLQLLWPPADNAHRAPILLDAAHNPAGAWTLRAALSAIPITASRTLVFGCMADKPIAELAQILFPVFDEVLLTRSSSPRAADLGTLSAAAESTGVLYRVFERPSIALSAALAATPAQGLIVLAGSIVLLGESLAELGDWRPFDTY